jgi:hypothetical protein
MKNLFPFMKTNKRSMFDGRGVSEEVALQVEREIAEAVADREMQEVTEQTPKTIEELVSATEDAVDHLVSILARNDTALEYLTALSSRAVFYLMQSGEPTPFAFALLKTEAERSVDEVVVVDRVKKILISEINPILYNLRKAILTHNAATQAGKPADELLGQNEGLIQEIKTGDVENQLTTSLFGCLEGLSATEKFVPSEFVVLNPLSLSKTNTDYWDAHASAHQEVAEGSKIEMAELMVRRSMVAVYELDLAASEFDQKGQEQIADQFSLLAQFINDRIDALGSDFKKTSKELSFFNTEEIGMSGEEIVEVLVAAEVVKRQDPLLYARLLGVAPGRQGIEADRSDLFGNIFHIALDKSLRSKKKAKNAEEIAGYKLIVDYLKGLCKKDVEQMVMVNIGEEQLHQLQVRLKTEIEIDSTKQNPVLLVELLGKILGGHSAKTARTFLEGVSEIKEQEAEKISFERELSSIFARAENLEAASSEQLEIHQMIIQLLAKRGEVQRARSLAKKYETEETGLIGTTVSQKSIFDNLEMIVREMPFEMIGEPDHFVNNFTLREEALIASCVADRLMQERDYEGAFHLLRPRYGHGSNEDVSRKVSRRYQAMTRLAYRTADAGLFQESEKAEQEMAKIDATPLHCWKVYFHRVEKALELGMIDEAVDMVRKTQFESGLSYATADKTSLQLVRLGRYEEALEIAKKGYDSTELSVRTDILLKKHKDGENTLEDFTEYVRFCDAEPGDAQIDIYIWRQRIKVEKALEIDSSEELLKRFDHFKRKGEEGERTISVYLSYLEAFYLAGMFGQVNKVHKILKKEFGKLMDAWGGESTMIRAKHEQKDKSRVLFKKISFVYVKLQMRSELVSIAHFGDNRKGIYKSTGTASHARKDRLNNRLRFVVSSFIKEKNLEDAAQVLKSMDDIRDKEFATKDLVKAYLASGRMEEAWKLSDKESNYSEDAQIRTAIIKGLIDEFTGEDAVYEYNQMHSWAQFVPDLQKADIYQYYMEKIDSGHWVLMEEIMEIDYKSFKKKIFELLEKYEESGRLDEKGFGKMFPDWVLQNVLGEKHAVSIEVWLHIAIAAKRRGGQEKRLQKIMRKVERQYRRRQKKYLDVERQEVLEEIALTYAQIGNLKKAFETVEKLKVEEVVMGMEGDESTVNLKEVGVSRLLCIRLRKQIVSIFTERYQSADGIVR